MYNFIETFQLKAGDFDYVNQLVPILYSLILLKPEQFM